MRRRLPGHDAEPNVLYGFDLNGFDTGTVIIGANAPGGGGWLHPKDPANQANLAFSSFKVTINATGTGTTAVTKDGGVPSSTPALMTAAYDSSGSLWDLTPGTGISAGHAALVTPHWDPNATNSVTTNGTNPDGTTTTTTITTTGGFVMPPPNTSITDSDLLLQSNPASGAGEKESFDFTAINSQNVVGFDMLFVGMSGDGNPNGTAPGEVHWEAKDATGVTLSDGFMHDITGSNTLRTGATFSADVAKHVSHLEFEPKTGTIVLPQKLDIHYADPSLSDATRETNLTNEFGAAVKSHASNDSLFPVSYVKDATGKVTGATISFNPDSPDIGVSYRGDILTGDDVNSLSGDGQQDIFTLGIGMQNVRDFETGLDKIQVGVAVVPDLAYAVKDALEIANLDHHPDMLLMAQNTMLWNEHGNAWKPSDFITD